MEARRAALRIGTSGYQYDHWKGLFYPEGLPKQRWFEHYAGTFDTVELNNTFYRLPPLGVFERWRRRAPPGFCFAVKYSRFGTHRKRLRDPADTLGRFLANARGLGRALGPILVQLPPRWHVDPERLEAFFEAADRRHRWVVEFRDPSWLCESVFRILERSGAALCIHDLLPDHPRRVTADFTYLRFHGSRYSGSYSSDELARAAEAVEGFLGQGWDVYAYFNNDLGGHAVRNALELEALLGSGSRRVGEVAP